MSYLQKLKELIGEEAFRKVEADLNGKELLVNDGTYIPKEKFNEKLEELKAATKDKEKLTADLKKLEEERNTGQKTVEQQLSDLTKKLEEQNQKIAQKELELVNSKKEAILKESLSQAGVKNPKNLRLLMKEFEIDKLELDKEGKLKGFDQEVKKLQEDYKGLFGEEKFSGNPPKEGSLPAEDFKPISVEDFYSNEVFGSR